MRRLPQPNPLNRVPVIYSPLLRNLWDAVKCPEKRVSFPRILERAGKTSPFDGFLTGKKVLLIIDYLSCNFYLQKLWWLFQVLVVRLRRECKSFRYRIGLSRPLRETRRFRSMLPAQSNWTMQRVLWQMVLRQQMGQMHAF